MSTAELNKTKLDWINRLSDENVIAFLDVPIAITE
jgi:hypothetical protein